MKTTFKLFIIMMGLLAGCTGHESSVDEAFIGKQQIALSSDLLSPEALWAMGRIGNVDVFSAANGGKVVYNVTYYSVKENKSRSVIYTMRADGSFNKLLTKSAKGQTAPVWIDYGRKIAYLSRENGPSRLWIMNADGAAPHSLVGFDKDIEDFKFSPDGKKVILIAQIPTNQSLTKGSKKYDDLPKASGIIVTDLMHKHWDEWVETIPHPFVAELQGNRLINIKDILEGEPYECPSKPFGGVEQLCWNESGDKILYSCKKLTGRDYALSTDSDIYEYDLATGGSVNLCKPAGYVRPNINNTVSLQNQSVNKNKEDLNMGYDTAPLYSPDGKYASWLSMARDGYESDRNRICVLELSTGVKRYVTESFESGADNYIWAGGDTLYFTGVWHGTTQIYRTNLEGKVEPVTEGVHDYASLALAGDKIIAKRHSMTLPDDIYSVDTQSGKALQLTRENEHILSQLALGEVKERWSRTYDWKQMQSWVIYPPHFDPSKKYPTLLFCEGGPQSPVSQFWSYRWNFQVMAAQGYIIIAPNRRGLPGYGMEWLEQISGDYAGRCMRDYLSAIDDLCKEPYVDKNRLGCVGASFGGYSVYWLAGHHNKRFKAFIAHDGMFNLAQQYLETEEMWFVNWDLGGAPWRKDSYTAQKSQAASPHLYVDKWDTPILCIHGEKDYRILASQGESAFNAAVLRRIPAELLLYPDENHWVLKPQNAILWQRTFFEWLGKWLK